MFLLGSARSTRTMVCLPRDGCQFRFVLGSTGRVRQLLNLAHVDGYRIRLNVGDASVVGNGAFAVIDGNIREEGGATSEERANVALSLEADDIGVAEAVTDGSADHAGQQFPVTGGRPGDMHELMDACMRELFSHHTRHQVELVIVNHHQRRNRRLLRLFDRRVGELLVHFDVAVLPCLVDGGVHAWCVGRTPHVVLDEPEQRIADDVVVLVVGVAGGRDEPNRDALPGQRRGDGSACVRFRYAAVAFAHSCGYPGEVDMVGEPAQRGYDTATATAGLERTVLRGVVLHRPAVRYEDEVLLLEQFGYECLEGSCGRA